LIFAFSKIPQMTSPWVPRQIQPSDDEKVRFHFNINLVCFELLGFWALGLMIFIYKNLTNIFSLLKYMFTLTKIQDKIK
jgi:hypothetical protein